jgi:hypothetical protein
VFPSPRSPRSAIVTPRDSKADEAGKDTAAAAAKAPSTLGHEVSPPISVSDTSFSSDSISYYLKLRKQEHPELQQQQQQQIRQSLPAPSSSRPQGNVSQDRQSHQLKTSPAPRQQLELRQVLCFGVFKHAERLLHVHTHL